MNIEDKIISGLISKSYEEEIDKEKEEFLDKHIVNKNSDEIANYLTSIIPAEIGGLTALSGFYYQFLVTIEHIIEMLDGKWDYVIMEAHDDVVVGKDENIRFIQVKTSNKVKVNVTEKPASDLYLRGSKKIDGSTLTRNNNWVDKLFTNAELTPKFEGFKTEFQLYASYHFIKTRDYDFDLYTDNENFNITIPDSDKLLEKMMESDTYSLNGSRYDYNEKCGESIKDLLSRFYIRSGVDLNSLGTFKNDLMMKLNNYLFKDTGPNITMGERDLHMLIGEIFTRCTYKDNSKALLITNESISGILSEIRETCIKKASESTEEHDSKKVINKVMDNLLKEFENSRHESFIQDKIYSYREYLYDWISSGGSIRQLLERYIDGSTRTQIYSKLDSHDRIDRLIELYLIVIILFIDSEELIKVAKNKGLLSKGIESSKVTFSFLSLLNKKRLAVAIEKIESILRSSDAEEQLFLIDKELHIIIQNYRDRDFNISKKHEFTLKNKNTLKEIDDYVKLTEVPIRANIVPGNELSNDFYQIIDEDDDLPSKLREICERYQNGDI